MFLEWFYKLSSLRKTLINVIDGLSSFRLFSVKSVELFSRYVRITSLTYILTTKDSASEQRRKFTFKLPNAAYLYAQ